MGNIVNKYKEYNWILRVIRSCVSYTQLRTPITRLIKLFDQKYGDDFLTDLLHKKRENHKPLKK